MRIGVNALYLIPGGVGGTEIYLRNLLRAFGELQTVHEFVVFTNEETGTSLFIATPHIRAEVQPVRAENRPARLLYEQLRLPRRIEALRLDCLLNCGFTAPAFAACPNVTVFHDLQHKRHPEYFRRFDLPAWQFFLWVAARRSRALVADSEATKADLLRFYGVADEQVHVAPLGVEREFYDIVPHRQVESPFFLCVSTLHPHKNLERLIQAFDVFRREHPEYRLVLTGLRGFHAEPIEALVKSSGCADRVELTGWLPRPDVYQLFGTATALFYPSTFEGFGLPVVEAMAAGLPVACSDIDPIRSISGEAAIRFSPSDTDAIVDAMRRLATDGRLRADLAARGRERAREYTWESCARRTLQAIEWATGAGPRVEPSHRSSRRDT